MGSVLQHTYANCVYGTTHFGVCHNGGEAQSIMGRSMRDENIAALLRWPHINVCTDGAYRGHPRGAGAFPRVFAHFARTLNVLSVEAAVQRMTSNAARNMGFEDRGGGD